MATKNNIRSIRFSDELAALIEQQPGESFTAKFEFLITKCVWELPEKEMELNNIQMQIIDARKQLGKLSEKARAYSEAMRSMDIDLMQLSKKIAKAQDLHWENEL